MNWKDLYTEATSTEREQILHLLAQRLEEREENKKVSHPFPRAWIQSLIPYYRRRLYRPRARVHWVGPRRRRRPERAAIGLLITAILLLNPYQFILWSLVSGSALSLFLIFASLSRFVPHKRSDRIRYKE